MWELGADSFLQQRCMLCLYITGRCIEPDFPNNVYIQGKKSLQCWSHGWEPLAMIVQYNQALMCLLELVGLFSNLCEGPTPEICLSVLQVSTPSGEKL